MLEGLLGNKSAERILLFLFVNERAYLSQIQQAYAIPLTPLQSMLHKFLQKGILSYTLQKRRKIYHLHPEYPLYSELKALLQKAFSLLAPAEKKQLFPKQTAAHPLSFRKQKERALCLHHFWEKLKRVKQMSIRSRAAEAIGEVLVQEESKNVLLFSERGRWLHPDSQGVEFHNALRWSFDFENGLVGLEHLRHGPHHPVFLFHLAPLTSRQLQSIDSHLCRNDCYFGQVSLHEQGLQFLWKIIGPNKQELLEYDYRCSL